MWKKVWAFIAFNVYAFFLFSAFKENTAYLFNASLIREINLEGLSINPRELGWGNHYVWFLISNVTVVTLVGFLAGAISKNKGALTAAVSNIPNIVVFGFLIYLFGFAEIDAEIEEKTTFLIISIIAIPITTYIAYVTGGIGQEIQINGYKDQTVFGIKLYHLAWAVFPIYWYSLGIIYVATKFISFQLDTWFDASIFQAIVSLVALLPVIAWVIPLVLVYRVLTGEILSGKNRFIIVILNFIILSIGMVVATGLQTGAYWLLMKMAS